ncbi:MAG: DnaB-like helicase C-terminal domain-containing protein [Bacteroidales bacterium]|nr:DnaB-like helicase C-terminal domain-containing protein [Bacteroidales bacterium]
MKQLVSKRLKNKNYLASGFEQLDNVTKGFKRKELTIIGGRPFTGKTSFGVSLCRNLIAQLFTVLYVSLELSADQLFERFQMQHSQQFNENIVKSNFFICETVQYPYDYSSLELSVRKLHKEKSLDIVILDYFQLIDNVQTESSSILLKLKNLAKELNLALVVFSQLSKIVEERTTKIPLLDDLSYINGNDGNIHNVFLISRNRVHEGNKTDLFLVKHKDCRGKVISYETNNNFTIGLDVKALNY